MKAVLFCLFISMIFCANNLRSSLVQEFQDETRQYEEFGNIDQCKIAKCITSKQVERWGILYQEFSPKYNQNQQECFRTCQIEVCEAKAAQKSSCQADANHKEYLPIYDENESGFRDYAPSQEKIKSQLAIDKNDELQNFLEKHHW